MRSTDCRAPKGPPRAALADMVDEYLENWAAPNRAEVRRFRAMPDLKTVISEASLARREDGKCESHQRRVGMRRLIPFERKLQRRRGDIAQCASFDDLHDLIRECRTTRVGALTVYDTAVRIGHYVRLAPKKVYLHTGTTKGARNLGLDTRSGYLNRADLPDPIRDLSCAHIENFLCIYKSHLSPDAPRFKRGSARGCRPRKKFVC